MAKVEINDFLYFPDKIYETFKEPRVKVDWKGKDGKVTWESFSEKWLDLWNRDDVALMTPMEQLRIIPVAERRAKSYINNGVMDITGSNKIISKPLKGVHNDLRKWEIHPDFFSEYGINVNLLGMQHSNKKGFEFSKFSKESYKEVLEWVTKAEKQFPGIKQILKDFHQIERALLKMRFDAGLLTKDQYDANLFGINKEKYVTRKHLVKDKNGVYVSLGKTDINMARKGSTEPIQNILTTLYENIYRTTQGAEYNMSMRAWFDWIAEQKKTNPKDFAEWNLLPKETKDSSVVYAPKAKAKVLPKMEIGTRVSVKTNDVTTSMGTNLGTIVSIKKNKIEVKFTSVDGVTTKAIFNKKDVKINEVLKEVTTPFDKLMNYDEYIDTVINQDGQAVYKYQNRTNEIIISRDGVKEVWGVPRAMRRAIEGFNGVEMNLAVKVMKKAADVLKVAATVNPKFIEWTWFRDMFLLPMTSKHVSVHTSIPFVGVTWGILEQMIPFWRDGKLGMSEDVTKFNQSIGGITVLETVLNDYKKGIEYNQRHPGDTRTLNNEFSKDSIIELGVNSQPAIDFAFRTGMKFENAPRFQEFKASYAALKKKFPNATERELVDKSGYSAMELVNFTKQGMSGRTWNKVSAFFTPAIRGIERPFERLGENPVKAGTMLLLTQVLPSILNHMQNINDPDYIEDWKENPEKAGQLNRIIPVKYTLGPEPGNYIWFKGRRSWGIGTLVSKNMEAIMDAWIAKDPIAYATWALSSLQQFAGDLSLLAVPTIAQPVISTVTNHNLFTGNKVLYGKYERLSDDYAYLPEGVSELSKLLARITNQNPFNVDSLIKGYVPGLGDLVLNKMDKIIREKTGKRFVPELESDTPPRIRGRTFLSNISEYPILGHFVENKGPKSNAAVHTRFWDKHEELEKIHVTYEKYLTMGEKGREKARIYLDKKGKTSVGFITSTIFNKSGKTNKELIKDFRKLNSHTEHLASYYKKIEKIKYMYKNKDKFLEEASDGTLRDAIDALYKKINALTYKALYQIGEIKTDPDKANLNKVLNPNNKKRDIDTSRKNVFR